MCIRDSKENPTVLDRVPMSTEGKLSRIQRGWFWHWRHRHCTRYGAQVVVLFASSAFLKMSLRTTIFLGDFFGPLTWCSRVLRFAHLSCTSTGPSVIGPRPRRVSSFTIFFFPPASLPPSSPPPRPFSSSSGQLSHSPARDNKKCHQTDKRNFPQTTHYFWNEREP